ncbi:putative methyltransferase [Trichoplax sp. H2]|uniref:Methyltransferase type 11 domain-containing protein n=1 Tax=Trichoplax adhaerens TaxID=10228 RepID=B3SAR5_TRIAD|nr:hypothetical protein TRIADDRAFT_61353 [Trichoplax adhaerens]EDV20203.1 hypothetical protein TRIADDRAFT_61353 [Trichoplax adhaerens]RDD43114.1 putative methyltransferase [Trichoplax sp. H2]|eukprot:XP_002117364.1 hypothetical protein TRIADDRAFT_61353 [Trichoplax adhaerens]
MTTYSSLFNIPGVSQNYSRFRPTYPPQLYSEIANFVRQRVEESPLDFAIDVACGPGLCTQPLGQYFKQVKGLDASHSQIEEASSINKVENVQFEIGSAYQLPCEDNSVDLVTCAQALHGLDEEKFFAEVDRILKPGRGCLALYAYKVCTITNSEKANQLFDHFVNVTLKDYFLKKWYNDNGYAHIELPYKDHARNDEMAMKGSMTLDEFINFIRSWATCNRLLRDVSTDPLPELGAKISEALIESTGKDIVEYHFPVFLVMWRKL